MGKKSAPAAPAAPDPQQTAAAQASANKEAVLESAKVNQINEVTPYGNVSYTGSIGDPDRTRITSLSDPQQRQLDQKNQLAELLGGAALDRAGQVPGAPFALPDNSPTLRDTSDLENRQFSRAMEIMQPQMDRDERRFETTMANRGIPIGSEAYNDARQQFDRSRDDMVKGAAFDAMKSGQAEQGRLYGLERQAYTDNISDDLLSRTQPMNELAAILQGSPALSNPNFGAPAQYQIAPADVMGAENMKYQGQMNAWNAANQNKNAMMGGLFSLGAAGIGAYPW